MPPSPDRVRAEALSLPSQERARLAHELIVSLDETDDPDAAEAWLVELERRARDAASGSVTLEDWEAGRARWAARWHKP